jgi:hypothetical protein
VTGEGQAKPASFWCRRVDGVFGGLVAVEGDVTGIAEGYHELAERAVPGDGVRRTPRRGG